MKTDAILLHKKCGDFVLNKLPLIIFLMIIAFSSIEKSYAQLSILDANVTMIPDGSSMSAGQCEITISDTTDCGAIELELYDGISDSLLFSNEFIYDQSIGLPQSLSWNRVGNRIELGLGAIPSQPVWKARVRLKNGAGNWGNREEFIFN